MMKKKIMVISLFTFAAITLMAIGCSKDYGSDIASVNTKVDNLDKRVGTLETLVKDIDAQVKGGSVITSVEPTKNGITVKLSNGKSYTITNGKDGVNGKDGKDGVNGKDGKNGVNGKDGKNGVDGKDGKNGVDGKDGKDGVDGKDGKNGVDGKDGKNGVDGKDGKDGSVVKIGENGNWFIDGRDTGLPSRGKDGAKGDKGEQGAPGKDGAKGDKGNQGAPGKDGKDGVWYEPGTEGAEKGFWVKVSTDAEGKKGRKVTTIKWLPEGTITAIFKDGVVTFFNVAGAPDGIKIGLVKLNNIIVIPDYVAEGGALPVVSFASLRTECGNISLPTEVKFRVSPSNVSVDLIDVNNLKFIYNNPTKLRANVDAKATFKSLKDGILTVGIDIDTKKLEKENSDKIDQVMLEVPMKNEGASVYSDWMTLTAKPIEYKDLAIARMAKKPTDLHKLTKTLEATKRLEAKGDLKDLRVIDIAYSETLDLNKELETLLGVTKFDMQKYGLYFEYDLKDEKEKPIVYELGANKTDQQKFINLSGSEVTTRVYDLDGANPASIDRTPIVRVQLKSTHVDCRLGLGFVKLNIIPVKVEPIKPTVHEIDAKSVQADCDEFKFRIDTKQMNEKFYAVAKMSKDAFHNAYKFEQLDGGIGTVTEKEDPEDTQSYNLVWTVTADELAENVGKPITKSAQYKYGENIIRVNFKATVKQPELNISGYLLDNYWFDGHGHIKHNVAVPALGSNDPRLCTFMNNISAAFKTGDDKLLDLGNEYTYEYRFAKVQEVVTAAGFTFKVSDDQKVLSATKGNTTEAIATINPSAPNYGDRLLYLENSDLAKELLNMGPEFMKARLELVVKNGCGKDVKVTGFKYGNKFDVHFLRPINVEPVSGDYFVDAATFGDLHTLLDIKNVVALEDWRNLAKSTKEYSFKKNTNYYDYYGVKSISIDIDKITTEGLTIDGKVYKKLPSTVEVKVYKTEAELKADDVVDTSKFPKDATYGVLGYKNNGSNLGNDFTLVVPVTVEYKWGKIVNTTVEVPVKGTSTLRSMP
ncbi:hypothetical protein IX335_000917 [Porphyromonas levii]|uniref:hypothetical protein n=1 Tax=Porphyromonas levii TaxID=28114 RepID=UPI001BAB69B0|nr:hypothetical protein [Porphyromonas levii]MBR8763702.1 hypothetical protein [Porphyromonas levii]